MHRAGQNRVVPSTAVLAQSEREALGSGRARLARNHRGARRDHELAFITWQRAQ
jgi:hypothetical protein